jgi:plasmid stabilization system protein ParE
MAQALRTAAAERDLENIGYQIAAESGRPATARKMLAELQQRCDGIAKRSHMSVEGIATPEIGAGVRLVAHRRWVILFRYVTDGITVLRIADGSQDYLSWRLTTADG